MVFGFCVRQNENAGLQLKGQGGALRPNRRRKRRGSDRRSDEVGVVQGSGRRELLSGDGPVPTPPVLGDVCGVSSAGQGRGKGPFSRPSQAQTASPRPWAVDGTGDSVVRGR